MAYKKIILKQGREISLLRKHHWVFSGAIADMSSAPVDSEIVEVYSARKEFLAVGYFCQNASIAIKILSFEKQEINIEFWQEKIQRGLELRKKIRLFNSHETNCYRLINAEGDAIPGLIIDIYQHLAVIQCQTLGIYSHLASIAQALEIVLPELKILYFQNSFNQERGFLKFSDSKEVLAKENNFNFIIDYQNGQKTGFFLDQRENRKLLSSLVKGQTVLNAFCYTGGFSVYALAGGATKVVSLDSSKQALSILEQNIKLNFNLENHQTILADYFKFISENSEQFDVIVLDPPAFAKSHKVLDNAIKGYRNINSQTMKKINPGGLLFTFSCSQAISKELFKKIIAEAALNAKKKVKILYQLQQSPCHPINAFHPESEYLKGLVLEVN